MAKKYNNPMGYVPLNYDQINNIEGHIQPSMLKYCNSVTYAYWQRSLFQRAISTIDFKNLPSEWEGEVRDFFYYCLFRFGYIGIFNHEKFGLTFQPGNLKGFDWYYQPVEFIVGNPKLKGMTGTFKIHDNCELIKLTPDYRGIWDIISYYTMLLSALDSGINSSIVNSKFAWLLGAKNKAAAVNEHLMKKYEIAYKPEGTLVDYREKEIRVMCPANTKWVKQSVGPTGSDNYYYMGFKAYAPEGAVSFKEGDRGVIIDEMFDFNDEFAGTDEYGRNYSICWLALASYDKATDTWTYFGKNSSANKYIGWDYVVEWYNADGVVIASDCIRINLSNEQCHSLIEPYYVAGIMKDVDAKIAEIGSAYEIIEF